MTKLVWKEQPHPESLVGYAGKVDIAIVLRRNDSTIYWKVDGVFLKYLAKSSGEAKTMAAGKRAAERAWGQWLTAAGLPT